MSTNPAQPELSQQKIAKGISDSTRKEAASNTRKEAAGTGSAIAAGVFIIAISTIAVYELGSSVPAPLEAAVVACVALVIGWVTGYFTGRLRGRLFEAAAVDRLDLLSRELRRFGREIEKLAEWGAAPGIPLADAALAHRAEVLGERASALALWTDQSLLATGSGNVWVQRRNAQFKQDILVRDFTTRYAEMHRRGASTDDVRRALWDLSAKLDELNAGSALPLPPPDLESLIARVEADFPGQDLR